MADARSTKSDVPAAQRQAAPPQVLSPQASLWLDELPQHLRPRETATRFPRIANHLAKVWSTPQPCRAYFDELLLDARGGRQGFPVAVALELAALKNHYDSAVHPTNQTVWDEIVDRARSR
jgi:hypothetical protein